MGRHYLLFLLWVQVASALEPVEAKAVDPLRRYVCVQIDGAHGPCTVKVRLSRTEAFSLLPFATLFKSAWSRGMFYRLAFIASLVHREYQYYPVDAYAFAQELFQKVSAGCHVLNPCTRRPRPIVDVFVCGVGAKRSNVKSEELPVVILPDDEQTDFLIELLRSLDDAQDEELMEPEEPYLRNPLPMRAPVMGFELLFEKQEPTVQSLFLRQPKKMAPVELEAESDTISIRRMPPVILPAKRRLGCCALL